VIALDTNVLVRFLVQDDKAQSAKAAKLVARAVARNQTLFVSDVVLCETVWVLLSAYQVSRAEVAGVLGQLFKATHLSFRDVDALLRALDAFVAGKGDFADYLIQQHARAAGCVEVATFDRALLKEKGFTSPEETKDRHRAHRAHRRRRKRRALLVQQALRVAALATRASAAQNVSVSRAAGSRTD
jgi:predicted nucleic-acid-binding protein